MSLVKHYECSGYALYKINIIIYILLYSFFSWKVKKITDCDCAYSQSSIKSFNQSVH